MSLSLKAYSQVSDNLWELMKKWGKILLTLKAFFIFKIFKSLHWPFGHVEKQTIEIYTLPNISRCNSVRQKNSSVDRM